jgi:Ni,Fe-hydrogenase I cytochrome b subunit
MQIMKWLSIASIAALIVGCFFPWVSIEHKNILVTGFRAEAISLGKPGLLHVILSSLFIVCLLLDKIWSFRTAFYISTFNIAWGVRNFVAVSSCSGGECPTKHFSLYLVLLAPILATVFMLLIKNKVEKQRNVNGMPTVPKNPGA